MDNIEKKWVMSPQLEKIKGQGQRVFKSNFNQSPFVFDYEREDIYLLPNGDELHIYLQEFGFLRKGILLSKRVS